MSTPETHPIEVVAMRAIGCAADGKNLLLAFNSKYAPERTYSVPIDCMKAFIADLQQLGSAPTAPPNAPAERMAGPPSAARNGQATKPAPNPNQLAARNLRRWMLGTGLPQHPVVLLVFEPQTPEQAAYVLAEDSARKMAAGLVQQAEQIAQHRSGSTPTAAPSKN